MFKKSTRKYGRNLTKKVSCVNPQNEYLFEKILNDIPYSEFSGPTASINLYDSSPQLKNNIVDTDSINNDSEKTILIIDETPQIKKPVKRKRNGAKIRRLSEWKQDDSYWNEIENFDLVIEKENPIKNNLAKVPIKTSFLTPGIKKNLNVTFKKPSFTKKICSTPQVPDSTPQVAEFPSHVANRSKVGGSLFEAQYQTSTPAFPKRKSILFTGPSPVSNIADQQLQVSKRTFGRDLSNFKNFSQESVLTEEERKYGIKKHLSISLSPLKKDNKEKESTKDLLPEVLENNAHNKTSFISGQQHDESKRTFGSGISFIKDISHRSVLTDEERKYGIKKHLRILLSPLKKDNTEEIESINELSEILEPNIHNETTYIEFKDSEKDVLTLCKQTKVLPMSSFFTSEMMSNCSKMGEGVYAEVYIYNKQDQEKLALKIIPVEGKKVINQEEQKTFQSIISEIIISRELSKLCIPRRQSCLNFNKLQGLHLLKGKYPKKLIQEWQNYSKKKESENDCPNILPANQRFIVFEFDFGGITLENFKIKSGKQAESIFSQVASALAVGERALQFEHRDLHMGNILIETTEEKCLDYKIDWETFTIPTHGVKATIIDFTISRLHKNGFIFFTDLSQDDTLFEGEGDDQFEVYRKMKEHNKNEWETFQPYTNILWLNYLLGELLKLLKKLPKARRQWNQLEKWKKNILIHPCATAFVNTEYMDIL